MGVFGKNPKLKPNAYFVRNFGNMENESVKSEQSGRSRRSRNHNNNGGG